MGATSKMPKPAPAYTKPIAEARLDANHSEIKKTCGTMPVKVMRTAETKPKKIYNCHSRSMELLRKRPAVRGGNPRTRWFLCRSDPEDDRLQARESHRR